MDNKQMPAPKKPTTNAKSTSPKTPAAGNPNGVFDVTKPKGRPSSTSRPVIVGHENQVEDPMLKTAKPFSVKAAAAPANSDDSTGSGPVVRSTRKIIKPLSDQTAEAAPSEPVAPVKTAASEEQAEETAVPVDPILDGSDSAGSDSAPDDSPSETDSPSAPALPAEGPVVPVGEVDPKDAAPAEETAETKESADDPKPADAETPEPTETPAEEIAPTPDEPAAETTDSADKPADANTEPDTPAAGETPDEPAADDKPANDTTPGDDKPKPGNVPSAPGTTEVDQPEGDNGADVDALAGQAAQKQQDQKAAAEVAARNQAIEKMIENKQFYVPIGHTVTGKKSGGKGGLIVLLVLLLLLAGAYLAVDAGLIDIGIQVPYRLIGK